MTESIEQQRLQNQLEALKSALVATNRDLNDLAVLLGVMTNSNTTYYQSRIQQRLKSLSSLSIKQQ